MTKLSIGGFKKNSGSDTPPLVHVDPIEVQPPVEVEPAVINTPVEPTVPTTTTTPEPTEDKLTTTNTVVDPVEPTKPNTITGLEPVVDSSLTPNTPAPTSAPEMTDESALTYLSEKLGRTVTSFDDLKPQEVPVETDPYLKSLKEWREKTGRPIEDFVKYQKDYTQLSDIDVAREFLKHKYPTLTANEIQLELDQFKPSEDDLERDASLKTLNLKKLATEGRNILEGMKVEFTEPIPGTAPQGLTPEIQQQLDLFNKVKQQYSDNEKSQQEYSRGIQEASVKTENVLLTLSDDLKVNYKVSEDTRSNLPQFINEMPHWKNEDGSWNHQSVAQDGVKIKHFDEIIKLVYEQGVNAGKENLSKEANNVTIGKTVSSAAQQPNGKKGLEISGLDKYLGGRGVRIGKR